MADCATPEYAAGMGSLVPGRVPDPPHVRDCVAAAVKLTGVSSPPDSHAGRVNELPLPDLEALARHFALELDTFVWLGITRPEAPSFRENTEDPETVARVHKAASRHLPLFIEAAGALALAGLVPRRAPTFTTLAWRDSADDTATRLRRTLHLSNGPVPQIRLLLERQGLLVLGRVLQPGTISGASAWITVPDRVRIPAILLNTRESIGRQNFTLMHEVAHLLRSPDRPTACRLSSATEESEASVEERRCNHFAAAFLLPAGWPDWPRIAGSLGDEAGANERYVRGVAQRAGVSYYALVLRLQELRLASVEVLKELKSRAAPPPGSKPRSRKTRVEDIAGSRTAAIGRAIHDGSVPLTIATRLFPNSGLRDQFTHDFVRPPERTVG